jgi:predicted nucleic acid-binding Zn ribbon protein
MTPCPVCTTPLDPGTHTCPVCGQTVETRAQGRRPARRMRLLASAAALGAVALVALPAVARLGASEASPSETGCEPRTFAGWHLAVEQACVAPAYVCENMTTESLLADPQVSTAYRRALEAGRPGAIGRIDALVSHVRSVYGCDGAAEAGDRSAAAGLLPPGHPPVGGGAAALPPGHPPIGGDASRLPPGHPPVGERGLPPGHPPVGGSGRLPEGHPPAGGPISPTFEGPAVVTI